MHGGKRENAGRPKGARNIKTREQIAAVEATGITPLEYMLALMRDENKDPVLRMDAAKSAAPYVHPRLSAVDHSGEIGGLLPPVIPMGFENGGPGEPSSSAESP